MIKLSGKKLISVIFILAIMISAFPLSKIGNVSANASSYECTSAKLQTLINEYTGTYWNGSYNGAYKCKGFADMMFNAMYGTGGVGRYNSGSCHYYVPEPRAAVEIARDSSATRGEIYDMMHKANSGDYIQWSRGYSQHSAIFVSCDENGFYIFDCNYISPNKCGVHYVTYDKLATKNHGVSIYSSKFSEAKIAERAAEEDAQRVAKEKAAPFAFKITNYTLTFEETVTPKFYGNNEIVQWDTSDNGVAVVDGKGKITAIGSGTATITVININGETSECTVTVECSNYKHVFEGFLNGFEVSPQISKAF